MIISGRCMVTNGNIRLTSFKPRARSIRAGELKRFGKIPTAKLRADVRISMIYQTGHFNFTNWWHESQSCFWLMAIEITQKIQMAGARATDSVYEMTSSAKFIFRQVL